MHQPCWYMSFLATLYYCNEITPHCETEHECGFECSLQFDFRDVSHHLQTMMRLVNELHGKWQYCCSLASPLFERSEFALSSLGNGVPMET